MAGSAVVAGGLMFVGSASAGVVVNESFEGGNSIFGTVSTYQYSQGYTSINIPPDAGSFYYTGNPGQAQVSRSASVSIVGSDGVSAVDIDAGLAVFDFSAWFSTYRSQNDWSSLTLQFQDQNGVALGGSFVIGGFDFVSSLGSGSSVNNVEERDWGQDSINGAIPVSARQAALTLFTQRLAGGAADGYTDVVRLNVSVVPEPGSGLALLVAGTLVGRLRVRRRPSV